jgi:hypothetical protein
MVNVNLALGMEGDIRANTYLHVFNPFRHLHVKISAFGYPTTARSMLLFFSKMFLHGIVSLPTRLRTWKPQINQPSTGGISRHLLKMPGTIFSMS